jgi:MFS family permease
MNGLDFLSLNYINSSDEQYYFSLSQSSRWGIYCLLILSNIFVSFDHGSIPASTGEFHKFIKSNQVIGLFGSLIYIGNIIGSLIFFYLINTIHRKTLLTFNLLFLSICLITFAILTKYIFFLIINRILSGIFQSFITIYLPIWCNQFGIMNKKGMMISYGQLVVPIGVFFGYLIASIFISNNILGGWKFAFIIQSFMILILSIIFHNVPETYFDKNLHGIKENDNTIFKGEDTNFSVSFFKIESNQNIKDVLLAIYKEKVFIYCVFALSSLYYVITGIQYWVSDYMENILLVKKQSERLGYFTLVCFTSPTSGVFLFGYMISKKGGYQSKDSLFFCFILGLLATIFAFIAPLVKNIFLFVSLVWLVLFFGGGIVPTLTGVIIDSLPQNLQAPGNSLNSLFCNLFGYLPSPYVYGFLSDVFGDKGKISMIFTMWFSFFGVLFIYLGMKLRYKNWEIYRKRTDSINEGTIVTRDNNESSSLIIKEEDESDKLIHNHLDEKLIDKENNQIN